MLINIFCTTSSKWLNLKRKKKNERKKNKEEKMILFSYIFYILLTICPLSHQSSHLAAFNHRKVCHAPVFNPYFTSSISSIENKSVRSNCLLMLFYFFHMLTILEIRFRSLFVINDIVVFLFANIFDGKNGQGSGIASAQHKHSVRRASN